MTATGNAALKLNRIHYLRPTKPEAAQAANTNHSRYRSNNFTQRGAHWYQRHAHEGYGGFQQFQNTDGATSRSEATIYMYNRLFNT